MELTKEKETMHLRAQGAMQQLDTYYRWSLTFLDELELGNVWDAGAGIGILADFLKKKSQRLLLTEYGEENLAILSEKYRNEEKVHVQHFDLQKAVASDLKSNKINTIVNLDVIEHLENDEYTLKLFYDILEKNGKLLLKTPAHPFLFCGIDKASNHYRRYTKKELKKKLEKAGFTVKKISYMNMPGAIMYFLKGKVLKKKSNFSNTFSQKSLNRMNKLIPIFQTIEKIIPPFFGLSVKALAVKT